MKILYTNFHPRNGGGHATYVANLAGCLQGEHEIVVATPASSRLYAQVSQIAGVRAISAAFSTRPAPMLVEVARLRSLLRLEAFDVVHVNGSADHRQVMLACLGLVRRPRIVFTKHNTMPLNSLGNRLRARLGTDGAIGVSDFVSRLLRQSPYACVPIQTIRHGVDTDRFRPRDAAWVRAQRHALLGDLPPGVLVLASVGGTDRDKGWLYLARALAALAPEEQARFRVLVAGDPLRGRLLEDFQALGLAHCVLFPGLVSDPERILALADAGFVLSDHEACSFAACESLATGLPTLVSAAGGLPEVVRDGADGWVVPTGDVAALKAWLLQRLHAPLPESMGLAARARALDSFSMPVFARNTLGFYHRLAPGVQVARRAAS
ncbi:glycosyltransferase [Castellaniella sp.]|uniref:glycosyltransferase n=1 Tax=Castellaniella sp. TaxID=1955812 RepID=UPI003562A84D